MLQDGATEAMQQVLCSVDAHRSEQTTMPKTDRRFV
jgi:hypothetical protein